jgi:hypothetical protein
VINPGARLEARGESLIGIQDVSVIVAGEYSCS